MEIRLISACVRLPFFWLALVLGQISSACSPTILSKTIALANVHTPYSSSFISSSQNYPPPMRGVPRFLVNACATLSSQLIANIPSSAKLDKATDGNFTSKVRLAFLIDVLVQSVDLGLQSVIWQSNIRPSLSLYTTINIRSPEQFYPKLTEIALLC